MQVKSKIKVLVIMLVGVLISTVVYGQDCRIVGIINSPESCEISTDRSRIQIIVEYPNYHYDNMSNSVCLVKMSLIGAFSNIDSTPVMDHLVDSFSFENELNTEAEINFVSAFGYLIFDLGRSPGYIFGINITTSDGRTFEEIMLPYRSATTPQFLIEPLPCSTQH